MTALTDKRYVLFTADCHIKRRTWNNSALLQGDSSEAFRQMLMNSDPYELETLLIGGDLFDSNRPSSADLLDVKFYLKYKIETVLYIRGNHDSVKPSFIRALEEDDDAFKIHVDEVSSHWIETPDYIHSLRLLYDSDTNPVYIAGIPYMSSTEELKAYIECMVRSWRAIPNKGTLYLMLHTAFEHLLGFDGAYQLTVEDIYNICGEDRVNILVGHIHTRNTTVYNEAGAYIHSPGALYPLSFPDMGTQHFATVIDLVTGELHAIPCDVRKYVSINLRDIPEGVTLESWLDNNGFAPVDDSLPTFVRVNIHDTVTGSFQGINNDKYITQAVSCVALSQDAVVYDRDYTFQEAVAEELAAEKDHEMLVEMADALLIADDPVGMLDDWTNQWGVRKAN